MNEREDRRNRRILLAAGSITGLVGAYWSIALENPVGMLLPFFGLGPTPFHPTWGWLAPTLGVLLVVASVYAWVRPRRVLVLTIAALLLASTASASLQFHIFVSRIQAAVGDAFELWLRARPSEERSPPAPDVPTNDGARTP